MGNKSGAGAVGPRGDTRQRMIDGAVALLRERSAAGVTVDAVLARSGAPRGSVYHHFPEGRDQIVLEAVQAAGQYVLTLIGEPGERHPSAGIRRFLTFWERTLRDADYYAGCPVVALTVDSSAEHPELRDLVNEIFISWHRQLAAVLTSSGIADQRSRRLATMIIASAEGAIILCRAQRSTLPLHDIGDELCALLDAAAPNA